MKKIKNGLLLKSLNNKNNNIKSSDKYINANDLSE